MKFFTNKLFLLVLVGAISISFVFSSTVNAIGNNTYEDDEQLVTDLAQSLELIYEDAIAYDRNGVMIGYKREVLERELKDNSLYEEIISGMEEENLLISENNTQVDQNVVIPYVANCQLIGKKPSAKFQKAQNKCIIDGLKSNYNLVGIGAGIANFIATKQYKKAAAAMIKAGVKGNVAGIIVVLGSISLNCSRKVAKQFPGDSNCVKK